jgi:hypothetical protein
VDDPRNNSTFDHGTKLSEPTVALKRIDSILTYEVQDIELDALEEATSEAQSSLGLACTFLGVFASALCTWVSMSDNVSAVKAAILFGTVLVSLALTASFGAQWFFRRRKGSRVLSRIRNKGRAASASADAALASPATKR